jgi:hypothetical protein
MLTTEDLTQGAGVILEASDTVTYIGFPKGTTSEDDAKWRIQKVETSTPEGGGTKTVITWADGDLKYDNVMSDCQDLEYSFLK